MTPSTTLLQSNPTYFPKIVSHGQDHNAVPCGSSWQPVAYPALLQTLGPHSIVRLDAIPDVVGAYVQKTPIQLRMDRFGRVKFLSRKNLVQCLSELLRVFITQSS